MINYTERIGQLMADVVARVPTLSFIDMSRVLVFARAGRSDAEGPYATCHCVSLPPSEPGYYYWRDRRTGALTRRSEWFVTKSPVVTLGSARIDYMVSFALPRFCDQCLVQYAEAGALRRLSAVDHQARHDRARALPHRSRAARAFAGWSAPTARARRTATVSGSSKTSCTW